MTDLGIIQVIFDEDVVEITYKDPLDQNRDVIGVRLLRVRRDLVIAEVDEIVSAARDMVQIARGNLRTAPRED